MTGDDPSAAATDALPLTGRELVETFPRYADLDEHVSVRELEPRAARTVPVDEVLRPELAANYPYDPFVHQARALAALDRGENVCVATSTSSGKTDVYGLQIARNVLEARARDAESTAYVVYPMKALAQDQQRELSALYDRLGLDIEVAVYDGDTETGETRRRIREEADVSSRTSWGSTPTSTTTTSGRGSSTHATSSSSTSPTPTPASRGCTWPGSSGG
jgi:DEAD/DEAH box helicase domain-containing protein